MKALWALGFYHFVELITAGSHKYLLVLNPEFVIQLKGGKFGLKKAINFV